MCVVVRVGPGPSHTQGYSPRPNSPFDWSIHWGKWYGQSGLNPGLCAGVFVNSCIACVLTHTWQQQSEEQGLTRTGFEPWRLCPRHLRRISWWGIPIQSLKTGRKEVCRGLSLPISVPPGPSAIWWCHSYLEWVFTNLINPLKNHPYCLIQRYASISSWFLKCLFVCLLVCVHVIAYI